MGLSDLLLFNSDDKPISIGGGSAPTVGDLIRGIGKAEGWGEVKYDARTRAPYGLLGDSINHPELKDSPQAALDFMKYKLTNPKSATFVPGLVNDDETINVDKLPELQNKWAPVGAGNDPKDLNSNWLTNVSKNLNIDTPEDSASDGGKYDALLSILDTAFPKKKQKTKQSGGNLAAVMSLAGKRPGADVPDVPITIPGSSGIDYPFNMPNGVPKNQTEADAIAQSDQEKDQIEKDQKSKMMRSMSPMERRSYDQSQAENGATDESNELTASLEADLLATKAVQNAKHGKIQQAAVDFTDAARAKMSSTGNPILQAASGLLGGVEKVALPVAKVGAAIAEIISPIPLAVDLFSNHGKFLKNTLTATENKDQRNESLAEKIGSEAGELGASLYGLNVAAKAAPALSQGAQFAIAQLPAVTADVAQTAEEGGDVDQSLKNAAISLGGSYLTGAAIGPASKAGEAIMPLFARTGSAVAQGATFGGLSAAQQSISNDINGRDASDINYTEVAKQVAMGGVFGMLHNPNAGISEEASRLKSTPLTPGDPSSIVDVFANNAGEFEITKDMLRPLKKEGLISKNTTINNIPPEFIQGVRNDHISRTLAKEVRNSDGDFESAINVTAEKLGLSDEQRQAIFDHEGVKNNLSNNAKQFGVDAEASNDDRDTQLSSDVERTESVPIESATNAEPSDPPGVRRGESRPVFPVFGKKSKEFKIASTEDVGSGGNTTQVAKIPVEITIPRGAEIKGETASGVPTTRTRMEDIGVIHRIASDGSADQITTIIDGEKEANPHIVEVRNDDGSFKENIVVLKAQDPSDAEQMVSNEFKIKNVSARVISKTDLRTWLKSDEVNKPIGEKSDAVITGNESENSVEEHQRIPSGKDVQQDSQEVREEASRPAGNSSGVGGKTQEPEIRAEDRQAQPTATAEGNEAQASPADSSLTSVKNATTDAERAAGGLPERETPGMDGSHEWQVLNKKAIDSFEKDPEAGSDLIRQIKGGKMPTDLDQFLLGIEKENRRKEFDSAGEQLKNAQSEKEIIAAEKRFGEAEDKYNEVFDVIANSGGTDVARSLAARNATIDKEDYSLAHQQAKTLTAINEGKPPEFQQKRLTREQRARVEESVGKVEAARIEAETSLDDAALSKAQSTFEELVARMVQGKPMRTGEKLRIHGEKIENEGKSEWQDYLKKSQRQLNVGIDPTALKALAKIGYGKLTKGAASFADFSEKMIADLGDLVKPYLNDIYKQSQFEFLKHQGEKDIESPQDLLAKAQMSAAEGAESSKGIIGKLIHAHLLLEKTGKSNLDRSDVAEIAGRVADDLRPSYPNITPREVNRIYSDYGRVRIPSKQEINIQLGEMRRIGQLTESLARAEQGLNPEKSGQQRRPPTEEMLKLEKEIKDTMQRNGIEPVAKEYQLASRLERYKKQIDTRTAELKARNDAGDFSKRIREKTPLDEKAEEKVAAYKREKNRHDVGVEMLRLANRPTWQKISNMLPKVARFNVLTYPATMGKLFVSAIQIIAEMPAFTIESMILRRLMPGLAEYSSTLKGASFKALGDAYVGAYKSGLRAAKKHLTMKQADHEILFGDKKDTDVSEEPTSKLESPSFVHATVKDFTKEGFFAGSVSERIAHMKTSSSPEAEGLRALSEDKAIQKIKEAAWKDAKRAIYLDENYLAGAWNAVLRGLRHAKNDKDEMNAAAQITADVLQSQMPIVRIATNIPKRAAERVIGLPLGIARAVKWKIASKIAEHLDVSELPKSKSEALIRKFAEAASKMDLETANSITRNIERGANGIAGFLLGYAVKNLAGGFYTGQKRDANDTPVGGFHVMGVDLPDVFGHTDLSLGIQMGNTFGRIAEEKGEYEAGKETILGLAEHTPFVGLITNLGTMFHHDDGAFEKYAGQVARQMFIPGMVQQIAKVTDKTIKPDPNIVEQVFGEKVKREANGFTEQIKSGIPGLRSTLPLNKKDYLRRIEDKFRSGDEQGAAQMRIDYNKDSPDKKITPKEYAGIFKQSQKTGDARLKIPEIEHKLSKAEDTAKPALLQLLSDKIDTANDLSEEEKDKLRAKYGLTKPVKEGIKSEIESLKMGDGNPYDYEIGKAKSAAEKKDMKKSFMPRVTVDTSGYYQNYQGN